jgi:peptide/nickel transport system ATP-binding protein/oligopeptide transport system ATP-binding protein
MSEAVLELKDLRVFFTTKNGVIPAVDGVSFTLRHREVLGIVGESGCGKTVTNNAILRLIPKHSGRIMPGSSIRLQGRELTELTERQMSDVRGRDIAMIFQDPMTALNPVVTVGRQIIETILRHQKLSRREAFAKAVELLNRVGIPDPETRIREYPHQLSGGMRQRIMIAIALSCNPMVLIADEPTTALDVTIQAQILELMTELRNQIDTCIILVTHDMGVVADMADTILVMYAGHVMEYAAADLIFESPMHPYTKGLLASIPRLDKDVPRLASIEGTVPILDEGMRGCRFASRCSQASDRCAGETPPLFDMPDGRQVRCWLYEHEGGKTNG